MSYRDEVMALDVYRGEYFGWAVQSRAAEIAARADAEIAALRAECAQWREELRIYRETESAECEALRAECERNDYALTFIIQLAERRADCSDIRTIARDARLPEAHGESR